MKLKSNDKRMEKLLIVTSDHIWGIGVFEFIKSETKFESYSVATSFDEMLSVATQISFSMMIVGLPLKHTEVECFKKLIVLSPAINVLVISSDEEKLPVRQLLTAGVKGIVAKKTNVPELKKAISQVYTGQTYIESACLMDLLFVDSKVDTVTLTRRERNIAELLVEGKSNTQICEMLNLQPSTVSTFKKRIYEKLNIKNVIQLTRSSFRTNN